MSEFEWQKQGATLRHRNYRAALARNIGAGCAINVISNYGGSVPTMRTEEMVKNTWPEVLFLCQAKR